MKHSSLARTVALVLLSATAVAHADETVSKASAPAAAQRAAAYSGSAKNGPGTGAKIPSSVEIIARPANRQGTNFEIDLVSPIYQPTCGSKLLALNIRGMRNLRRNTEGNFGAYYRQIIRNSFVLGGYAFGDTRRTRAGNSFGQLTLGVDVLSDRFDARFNGYIAQSGRKLTAVASKIQFAGNKIMRFDKYESPQSGFDSEIGMRIPIPNKPNVEMRFFVGGYRFARAGTQTMAGPRGRLEVRIGELFNHGSDLTLGVNVSNDKVRKTTVSGVIGIKIPLRFTSGTKMPTGLQRRLAGYVYRDVDIVTSDVETSHQMINPDTSQPYFVINVAGPGGTTAATTQSGDGTAENPFAIFDSTSQTAINAQSATVTRIAGTGAMNSPVANFTVQTNQLYFGAGANLFLVDATDDRTVKVQTAGTGVTITDTVGTPMFNATTGNPTVRIAGFTYVPMAAAGAGLINATYTGDAQMIVQDMIFTGNATTTTPQINVTFNGTQTSGLSVSNATFTGFTTGANASGVQTLATAGATVTINTRGINFTGVAGAGVGQWIQNNASNTTFTDTGSAYSAAQFGVSIDDQTLSTSLTEGVINFTINGMKATNITNNSVEIRRVDGAGDTANTTITGIVSGSSFTTDVAVAGGADIAVGGGTGAVDSNVTLNLTGNTHNNNNINASVLRVELPSVAGNPSIVTVNMSNIKATGFAGGSGIVSSINAAADVAGAIVYNMTNVTTSGYSSAIALVGAAPIATAGQIEIDLSGGGNVFGATTNSFNGNGLATLAGLITLATADTFAPLVAAGPGVSIAGVQFPQAVVQ